MASAMDGRQVKKSKEKAEEERKALAYKQMLYGQVFLKYGSYGFPK